MFEIACRPMVEDDLPKLLSWFDDRVSRRWWVDAPRDLEQMRDKYVPRLNDQSLVRMRVFTLAERPIGFGQWYSLADFPAYAASVGVPAGVGMDLLVGPAHRGQGLGPSAVKALIADSLRALPSTDTWVASPDPRNKASCQTFAKLGFKPTVEFQTAEGRIEQAFVLKVPSGP